MLVLTTAENVRQQQFAHSLKKLVAAENTAKPLSDSKIAALLADQGIQVARRTIAKYRESLGIAPSSQRKRLL
jgi:RNA polymerase sigma-54 factor